VWSPFDYASSYPSATGGTLFGEDLKTVSCDAVAGVTSKAVETMFEYAAEQVIADHLFWSFFCSFFILFLILFLPNFFAFIPPVPIPAQML
jgi:hypothetical protein